MTDQIIELAKQAGFQARGDVIRTMHSSGAWVGINDELQRFAELVGNAKLEEAASAFDKADRPIVTTVEAAWIIRGFK